MPLPDHFFTQNIDLTPYNTFKISCIAQKFCTITQPEQLFFLTQTTEYKQATQKIIIGGGSNLLFTQPVFKGLIIHNRLKNIEVLNETTQYVLLKIGSGENWDKVVQYALKNNWGGIENLSLIPGTAGAAPVQNIGAYGVEIKQTLTELQVFDFETNTLKIFSNQQCQFEYRNSIFKQPENKNRFFITYLVLKLTKPNFHTLNTHYGDIEQYLTEHQLAPTIHSVAQAVFHIRNSKLPNPEHIANAGSFFKNPEVPISVFEKLKQQYPNMPHYPAQKTEFVKLAAGWLVQQAGFKGYQLPNTQAGVHTQQALVLVNYGHATGKQILELANTIQSTVKKLFNIDIFPEVNII